MIAGALLFLAIPVGVVLLVTLMSQIDYRWAGFFSAVFGYLLINLFFSFMALVGFEGWQRGYSSYLFEKKRMGSARFASLKEEQQYLKSVQKGGLYIGGGLYYNKSGHLLTCAGTRGGKGVNLIVPNLLPAVGAFAGSWVIVDPKGENAAISARVMAESGKKVVMLNPWGLLQNDLPAAASYNPLDILKHDRTNLSDDVEMIAESIVPMKADKDDHWDNRARSLISGLLLHLVTYEKPEKRHLGTLWEWLRLETDKWGDLLKEMLKNNDPIGGDIVRAAAFETTSQMDTGAEEFASILSTARKHTDIFKSPALREALQQTTGFSSAGLVDGNTAVYVIIPADRLKTHARWLRLVVSTLMRAVIRNPKNDVCFLLDEFYALGYLSEIETALGAYAGFNVHVWAVVQNLVQLNDMYGNNWQNFISSCSVRQFFNIADNFTADYVSSMLGQLSIPTFDAIGRVSGATGRNLVNADELRKRSGDMIYAIIDNMPPAELAKLPYFDMNGLKEGVHYDRNPYFKG